jgi:hypothetical protein
MDRVARTFAPALLFICSLPFLSCRDTEVPQDSGNNDILHPVFREGERFVYDAWDLNRYGQRIDSTHRTHSRVVRSVQGSIGGVHDAVVLSDSIVVQRTGTTVLDTLYYRVTSDRGLEEFGFLSRLVRKREGVDIPSRWDRLYQPGVPSWIVGVTDSAGQERLIASLGTGADYFQISYNMMALVFPAWRVEMSGVSLDYALWLSDTPTCLPRLEEPPYPYTGIFTGSLLILRDATSPQ